MGLIILANSRPFEGLLVSLPVAGVLTVWLITRHRPPIKTVAVRIVLPAGACLLLAAAAMGYYNYRVTGSALKMPYKVHEETYTMSPLFAFKSVREEPDYHHAEMRKFYRGHVVKGNRRRDPSENVRAKGEDLKFFVSPALTLPLLAFPWVLRRRWMWFVVGTLLFLFVGSLLVLASHPHYYAPGVPLLFLFGVQGLRYVRRWSRSGPELSRMIVPCLLLLQVFLFAQRIHGHATELPDGEWAFDRARIVEDLQQIGGRHLVIVKYAPDHVPDDEWVYNRADIDGARIIWAREMGPAGNQPLIEYAMDRTPWLLIADEVPRKLIRYPVGVTLVEKQQGDPAADRESGVEESLD
jgi:hypothetical protein